MIDLTNTLANLHFPDPHREFFESNRFGGTWTPDRLRALLDRHKVAHRAESCSSADGGTKYKLTVCPCCRESEGNPAAWVYEGYPIYKCHRANKCNADFAALKATFAKLRLEIVPAADLLDKHIEKRPDVIRGLLRRGDVANIIGGPKARKSFLVMQAALCVATGTPFLGWPTVQGRCLLIDNELRRDDLAYRMRAMVRALGLDQAMVTRNVDLITLRGKQADVNTIRAELASLPVDSYSLVVCDALYKLLPVDADENSNSNMTAVYVALDATAEEQNCAVACVHHTSKGTQAGKSVTDMGAGAGAQSRSADLHVVLRDHEDADTVVLAAVVRSQPPVEPICLQFAYPIWSVAEGKDPAKLHSPNKKPAITLEQFLQAVPTEKTPKTDVLANAKLALGTSNDGIRALYRRAEQDGLIEVERPKNRTLPYMVRRVTK